MRVFVISGKAQNGKDTVADMIKNEIDFTTDRQTLIIHYADLLKYICRQYFGWDGVKDEYGRSLLQRVGTDVVREQSPDFWVSFVASFLTLFKNEWDYAVIPDCRFPNEIDFLKDAGLDVTHIHVERPGYDNGLTEEQLRHPSETALDGVEPDVTIVNNGSLAQLRHAVDNFVKEIMRYER